MADNAMYVLMLLAMTAIICQAMPQYYGQNWYQPPNNGYQYPNNGYQSSNIATPTRRPFNFQFGLRPSPDGGLGTLVGVDVGNTRVTAGGYGDQGRGIGGGGADVSVGDLRVTGYGHGNRGQPGRVGVGVGNSGQQSSDTFGRQFEDFMRG